LRRLNTGDGSNDDDGAGRLDARYTSSMTAHHNSNRVDSRSTVDSTRRDNSCIHNRDSQLPLQFQLAQFQPQRPRQNAAPKRKRIHLPPMQLREVFSYIFPSCLLFARDRSSPTMISSLCILNRTTTVTRLPKKKPKTGLGIDRILRNVTQILA